MSGSIAQYISSTRDSFAENSSVEFLLNPKNLGKSKKKWIFICVAGVVTISLIVIILCSLLPYSPGESPILLNNNTETLELESMDISSNSTYETLQCDEVAASNHLFRPRRGNLLTSLSLWPKEYEIKFDFFPFFLPDSFVNILHVTKGGNNDVYGDRSPSIYAKGGSDPFLHICSSINGNKNYCMNFNISSNTWISLRIAQKKAENQSYEIEYTVDNIVMDTVVNGLAMEFENVKIYSSNPWVPSLNGILRNVEICYKATKKNMTTNLIQGLDNKVTENQIELKKINFNLTKLKNKLIEKNLVPRPKDKKDVEKEIIYDYQVTKSHSCGGVDIKKWDDGTNSNWGLHKGISRCKDECNKHDECAGFVVIHSLFPTCGHWKRSPLKLTQELGKDRDCYLKEKETMNTNDGVTSKGVESDLKSNLTNIMEETNIDCRTTDDTTISIDEVTRTVPDQNQKCVFPFEYENKLYSKCTNHFACKNCYWCGTQFNVTAHSGWGMCNGECQ